MIMKKTNWGFGIWVAPVFLFLSTAFNSHAGDFNCTTNNGTITITKYTGTNTAVTIPDEINNQPVRRVGDAAFYNCTSLTNVIIGTNVTSIGDNAFGVCTHLTSVTIPAGVTNIGEAAFYFCTGLTNISVHVSNPVYSSVDGVLFNENQTILIECPAGIAEGYTIPNGVTNIGSVAFNCCYKLTSMTVPNGVTFIGSNAFVYCTSLASVTIPTSVISIEDLAFEFCYSLTAIVVNASNSSYSSADGVLFDQNHTTLIQCPEGKAGSYEIPTNVVSIGDNAFWYCTSLTSIMISTNVASIGDYAFYNCTHLTSMTIPASVASIGNNGFAGCSLLANVTILNGVTNIGDYAFWRCTSLTSVTIPNSVILIPGYAFAYCTSLTNLTIPASVSTVSSYSFAYCTNLMRVYFQGNAPDGSSSSLFYNDNSATIYYMYGTKNWTNPWGGRPTVLWNPQAQPNDATFGVQTNGFGFNIAGSSNITIVVEACTNLVNPVWVPVSTNTIGTNGLSNFRDSHWSNYSERYYRFRAP